MKQQSSSFKHPNTKVDDENTWNVNDLILALERFKAEHGDAARVALIHQEEDGEIIPYQVEDVDDAFYDYERGDVCNIQLTQ